MAKSSRSKWKRAHRRERAVQEKRPTAKRISRLHGKLRLAAASLSSLAAPQDVEKRFHFLNPEFDTHVAHPLTKYYLPHNDDYEGFGKTRKEKKLEEWRRKKGMSLEDEKESEKSKNKKVLTNFHVDPDLQTGEIDREDNIQSQNFGVRHINFNEPLTLSKPRTNFYGKSDPLAPHPQTVQFDTIDADAPVAGHAMTKYDLERMEQRAQQQQQQLQQQHERENEEEEDNEEITDGEDNEDDSNAPVEFQLTLGDGFGSEELKQVARHNKKNAKRMNALLGSVTTTHYDDDDDDDDDDNKAKKKTKKDPKALIKNKGNRKTAEVSGSSKVKKMSGAAAGAKRVVSSGSKAAKNKSKKK